MDSLNEHANHTNRKAALVAIVALTMLVPMAMSTVEAQLEPLDSVTGLIADTACDIEAVAEAACVLGGERVWVNEYDGPKSGTDKTEAIAMKPDGSAVFITGRSSGVGTHGDMATMAYDAEGAEIWLARYDGPANGRDHGKDIAVSPDGTTVYVVGSSEGTGSGDDYVTIAYDSETGQELWTNRYEGSGAFGNDDRPYALAVSPDGETVFVTGTSGWLLLSTDMATVAYDASTGDQMWAHRYDGPGTSFVEWDTGFDLVPSPDSSKVYVAGTEGSATVDGDMNFGTLAYERDDGTLLWTATYDGPANERDEAKAVTISADGETIYVTGNSRSSANNDFFTIAYRTSDGTEIWSDHYDGPGAGHDGAVAVALDPETDILYVAGYAFGSDAYTYAVVAYDAATGDMNWDSHYQNLMTVRDAPTDLQVSPEGSYVVITGATTSDQGQDATTVAFSTADGSQLWHDAFAGAEGGPDKGAGLVISPDGQHVFTAATARGDGTAEDYVTIAYAALEGLSIPVPV